ncbi:MAG: FkbM family methyltransferase [Ignavibacteriota bacterium]
MKALFKNIAYRILPQSAIRSLKALHHKRTFNNFRIEQIPEFEVMSQLIPKDSVVLDIGANIGLLAKCFSRLVGKGGLVYALEPVPETFGILNLNAKRVQDGNVIPLNIAASNKDSTVKMVIPSYQSRHGVDIHGKVYEGSGDNFYEAKIISQHESSEEANAKYVDVRTKTIDSLFSDSAGRISFIKCDVEGHELECFLGSLEILRSNHPAILVEVMDDPFIPTGNAYRLFELLKGEGYAPYYLHNGSITSFTESSGDINFFFLQPNHVAQLGQFVRE